VVTCSSLFLCHIRLAGGRGGEERVRGHLVGRGGHRHRQVGRMPDTDLKPDLRSKGVKDHTFLKNRRQISCPLPRSLLIVVDHDD
jgi:hypothetical protein